MVLGLHRVIGTSRGHLSQVRESYGEHLRFAFGVGAMMVAAGLACCLHALVPAVCRDTGSRTIRCLSRLLDDRSALEAAATETADAVAFALVFFMSLAIAVLVWALGARAVVALPLTLLALALPAAVLAANPDLRVSTDPQA
jgi:hypothetical protein